MFFHRASRTLILTDTVMNPESSKTGQPWRTLAKLAGMNAPGGGIFFGMRLPLLLQRQKAKLRSKRYGPGGRSGLFSLTALFETDAEDAVRRFFGD